MANNKEKTNMEDTISTNKYVEKNKAANGAVTPGNMGEIPEKVKKDMEKTKEKLEQLKAFILKKYKFTQSIGIIPPQVAVKFEEEEEMSKEEKEKKYIHVSMIIPEEKVKEIPKIKVEVIKKIKELKQNIWMHIDTPVDVWQYGLDGKYELVDGIAMSFPLYDKGLLDSLRVAAIHKNLVLRKFERYVTSYIIAGSLVRGTATKNSDVDVYVIIDDTDVKRMPRLELKEKLRAIIYQYIAEASALAGVQNKLNVQVYILTEFWEAVKDAHPVMFTFIRDGIPLFDKGTFTPWKLLLKMGKLKPSPEAIDMFMSMGDKVDEIVKRRLLDIVVNDIYWSVITPTQALLMLAGNPPPVPKDLVKETKRVFHDNEKLLEKSYIDILDNVVRTYKEYEHGKDKKIGGKEIDKFLEDTTKYIKRLKELRKQIEKRAHEKTIEQLYQDLMGLLKGLFGNKSQEVLVKSFEKELIKSGKVPVSYNKLLKDIFKARQEFKKGKLDKNEVERVRKDASVLINYLIEYGQRCELASLEKGKMVLIYKERGKEKHAEVLMTSAGAFLIYEKGLFKVAGNKLQKAEKPELERAIAEQRGKKELKFDSKVFDVLKKELGTFEIVM